MWPRARRPDPGRAGAFTIRHLLIHKVRGTFGAFTGQIVTGDEVTRSSVSAQIDLDSLDTGDAGRDKGTVANDPFVSRAFASFRIARFSVSAAQRDF